MRTIYKGSDARKQVDEPLIALNPCPVPWCTGVGQLVRFSVNTNYGLCPACGLSSPIGTVTEVVSRWNHPKGWDCFHCQEHFSTIGSARDHFGGDQGSLAGCQIKVGEERGLLMALRKAEAANDEWRKEALAGREEIESLEIRNTASLSAMHSYRPFRECASIQEVFFVYDSVEGRALAAEGQVKELEAERDTMRQELRSRAEAIVALTAEVERLRPVVEAVREEYQVRLEWAFAPNHSVHAEIEHKKTLEKARCKITAALASLASKEGEAK